MNYSPTIVWLEFDYCLTIFWLHSDYILTTFWLHSDYILTTFRPHSDHILIRVAEVGSLLARAKIATYVFVRRVFAVIATNISLGHFGQQAPENPVSQFQNGVSTSPLPLFIVDLLAFKNHPRSSSFFQWKFMRVLKGKPRERLTMGRNSSGYWLYLQSLIHSPV